MIDVVMVVDAVMEEDVVDAAEAGAGAAKVVEADPEADTLEVVG
ncbi:hypothetical protein ACQP1K_06395 [Sphaerimonospora sp. CA-214678]